MMGVMGGSRLPGQGASGDTLAIQADRRAGVAPDPARRREARKTDHRPRSRAGRGVHLADHRGQHGRRRTTSATARSGCPTARATSSVEYETGPLTGEMRAVVAGRPVPGRRRPGRPGLAHEAVRLPRLAGRAATTARAARPRHRAGMTAAVVIPVDAAQRAASRCWSTTRPSRCTSTGRAPRSGRRSPASPSRPASAAVAAAELQPGRRRPARGHERGRRARRRQRPGIGAAHRAGLGPDRVRLGVRLVLGGRPRSTRAALPGRVRAPPATSSAR